MGFSFNLAPSNSKIYIWSSIQFPYASCGQEKYLLFGATIPYSTVQTVDFSYLLFHCFLSHKSSGCSAVYPTDSTILLFWMPCSKIRYVPVMGLHKSSQVLFWRCMLLIPRSFSAILISSSSAHRPWEGSIRWLGVRLRQGKGLG